MKINSVFLTDGYKVGHIQMYPQGIQKVFSNFTPRSSKYAPKGNNNKVLNFGYQYVIKYIQEHFEENFFKREKKQVLSEIKEEFSLYLNTDFNVNHYEKLHDLGFLPIEIRTLDEGIESSIKVPVLTIVNTIDEFYWVTNYLETLISNLLWQPITSATTSLIYKKICQKYLLLTDKDNESLEFLMHDFSYRGLTGTDAVIGSGMAHAAVFQGSDSIPSILGAKHYYNETGFIVGSVNATEHSQMTSKGSQGEYSVFEELIDRFPAGILSIVSDSYDLWRVLTDFMPKLKNKIVSRDGTIVLRPDSSPTTPADIICGLNKKISTKEYTSNAYRDLPQNKGAIELLWDVFGGTINSQGYKVLDSHIKLIYGEAISTEMAEEIYQRLQEKGFASTNVIFGIGSASFQWKTRDTWGMAMKCTAQLVNNEWVSISKEPITDDGTKKSAKGLLMVNESLKLIEGCSYDDIQSEKNQLKLRFKNGVMYNQTTLTDIRNHININL